MKKKTLNLLLTGITAFAIATGCSDEKTEPIPSIRPLLELKAKIITSTYKDLYERTKDLKLKIENLLNNPTEQNLEEARSAWREARRDWEMSEGFLFGPVDNQGLDPAIDSWPVDKVDLDNVLASNAQLTTEYVSALEEKLKGFHTIEYLLFGENANKKISEFTPRQYEYLVACVSSLQNSTLKLYDTWEPSKENFSKVLIEAGEPSNQVYVSQKAGLQDLANGLLTIADEVGTGKIGEPFVTKDLGLEESQFSDNSKVDFQDNMRSVQNIYLGQFKGIISPSNGNSFSDWVKKRNPDLDSKLKKQIQESIDAIGAIPGTFSDAVMNNRPAVQNAQDKVLELKATLESELIPLVNKF